MWMCMDVYVLGEGIRERGREGDRERDRERERVNVR